MLAIGIIINQISTHRQRPQRQRVVEHFVVFPVGIGTADHLHVFLRNQLDDFLVVRLISGQQPRVALHVNAAHRHLDLAHVAYVAQLHRLRLARNHQRAIHHGLELRIDQTCTTAAQGIGMRPRAPLLQRTVDETELLFGRNLIVHQRETLDGQLTGHRQVFVFVQQAVCPCHLLDARAALLAIAQHQRGRHAGCLAVARLPVEVIQGFIAVRLHADDMQQVVAKHAAALTLFNQRPIAAGLLHGQQVGMGH